MGETRRRLLARIHILKVEAGIDDEEYRFMLQQYFAQDSAKDLNHEDMERFVSILLSCKSVKTSRQNSLIFKLWNQLFEQKKTGSGSQQSLNRWIKRQTGVDRLEWLKSDQKAKLIESLKQWLNRPSK